MKGYWIAKYKKAEDAKKLGSYAEKALKAITDFGGKPLVRGCLLYTSPSPRDS